MSSIIDLKIQAIAPSGCIDEDKFYSGYSFLTTKFSDVRYSKTIFAKFRNMAGNDSERARELISALEDEEIDLLWAIRGGFGASRVLQHLSNLHISKAKLLIGYSDITAYQLYLLENYGIKSISGAMIQVDLPVILEIAQFDLLISLITQNKTISVYPDKDIQFFKWGIQEGVLVGGCLSVISKLLGTPYSPTFSKKILFLEDVNEPIYRIDGYFSHLKNAGVFDSISAVILGQFTPPDGVNSVEYENQLLELYDEYFFQKKIPVIYNYPIGHFKGTYPLPIGYNCILSEEKMVFIK